MEPNKAGISRIRKRLFLLGLLKIPMLGFVRPRLLLLDEDRVNVRIRLTRRTKNHLKSMYFAALAVGADLSAGIHAFYFADVMGKKVSLAFKGIKGEFHMRAETDVIFVSEFGAQIRTAMEQSLEQGERINLPVPVHAYNAKDELVATFEMILSVRVK